MLVENSGFPPLFTPVHLCDEEFSGLCHENLLPIDNDGENPER